LRFAQNSGGLMENVLARTEKFFARTENFLAREKGHRGPVAPIQSHVIF
jgi:hypothetical protein